MSNININTVKGSVAFIVCSLKIININNHILFISFVSRNCLCRKMTLAKMDQRFQLISHHRDDKQTESPRALNPVINNSKPNKVSSEILKISRLHVFFSFD
ncbi:SKI family transcriptional corepressor 2 isoform X2 [Aphis craccivora]|uniref:SKI family transcriptional corepressor 2 isoform X2 n=1 Tax=Aphis craccivora TaxID=307492 RepID=A0A6G0YGM5_APHCR|nr:SKI family transcriptional corepressor 2 isoform X2 [Aphis craccivora]